MRKTQMQGFSLVETSSVLGILGLLSVLGLSRLDFGCVDLMVAQEELRGGLHQAFHLARASGSDVVVALGDPKMEGVLPVQLPRSVKWGKPADIPLPIGMAEPRKAVSTG